MRVRLTTLAGRPMAARPPPRKLRAVGNLPSRPPRWPVFHTFCSAVSGWPVAPGSERAAGWGAALLRICCAPPPPRKAAAMGGFFSGPPSVCQPRAQCLGRRNYGAPRSSGAARRHETRRAVGLAPTHVGRRRLMWCGRSATRGPRRLCFLFERMKGPTNDPGQNECT
ncbi:unnamed protein product [Amoebophrya sp. A120]|nr:unnamed protein product [Amoebophrya sp. A120]|eukprot:GSA120T00024243001.1